MPLSPSRKAAGRLRAARVVIALAAAMACAGAVVAYAASRPGGAQQGLGEQRAVQQPASSTPGGEGAPAAKESPERLLRPRLLEVPAETTADSDPQFRFHVPSRKPPASTPPQPVQPGEAPVQTSSRRFQCRFDGADWSECQSPYRLAGLAPGSHHFAVRALNREERAGEAVDFDWRQTSPPDLAPARSTDPPARDEAAPERNQEVEPKPFSIVALREPKDLYPGLTPTPIPVRVSNPNEVAIEVTAITVAIDGAPADCAAGNFALTPASASPENPLVVPADSSVELPAAGTEAPAIRMLDLPVEQDACRGAEIPLVFSGEAQG